MDLEFVSSAVRKSKFENEGAAVRGMKIQVSVNLELVYPNQVKEGSAFLLVTRTIVGSPIQKFYIYLEQVSTFKIVNLEAGFDTSRDNMQKFISVICHPIALKETQKTMDQLTKLYGVNPIKLPTGTQKPNSTPGNNIINMSGKGRPN